MAALLAALVAACSALCDREAWVSYRREGAKIGYAHYHEADRPGGRTLRTADQKFRTRLMGQPLEIEASSVSLLASDGQLVETDSTLSSGGRTTKVRAVREGLELVVRVEGEPKAVRLPLPPGGHLADDPAADLFLGLVPHPKSVVFDSQNLSLVQNEVKPLPGAQLDGKPARAVEVQDPRFPVTFYLSSKGDVILAKGPFAIEMVPATQAEAALGQEYASDLSVASKIEVGDLDEELTGARASVWTVTGATLKPLDGSHQVLTGETLTVRPARSPDRTAWVSEIKGMDEWLRPEPRIACDDPEMAQVAKEMAGPAKSVWVITQRVRRGVHEALAVNAGIGVLRDAREVWKSKEGVCRDHAVLMATLLRASKVPTRLVTGLVYQDGALYYHAWVEVYDGHGWFGVDSTRGDEFLSAGHIKTAQGHLAEVTTGFLLPGAKFRFVRGEK